MDALGAVKKAVEASGKTTREVSEQMGRSEGFLSATIAQSKRKGGGLNSATLAAIAGVCGYSLALVPPADLPGSAITIDPPEQA